MVQGHAHERRQRDNVSEQDDSCSGHVLLCQSNLVASRKALFVSLQSSCDIWDDKQKQAGSLSVVVADPKGHKCALPSLQHLDSATCLLPQSGTTGASQPAVKTGVSGQMDRTSAIMQVVQVLELTLFRASSWLYSFRRRSTVSGSTVKWTGKQIPNRKRQKGYKPMGS